MLPDYDYYEILEIASDASVDEIKRLTDNKLLNGTLINI